MEIFLSESTAVRVNLEVFLQFTFQIDYILLPIFTIDFLKGFTQVIADYVIFVPPNAQPNVNP